MKSLPHLHYLLLAIFFSFVTLSDHDQILKHLESWHYNVPQEKVFVKQDKPYYVLGEKLWFKAFVVNAMDHSFLVPSQTLYVELRDSNGLVLDAKNIRITEGAGAGDFLLSPSWSAGTYHLHAYTSYMLNFDQGFHFVHTFEVGSIRETGPGIQEDIATALPKVDLYPEGGHLICGLPGVVAVRSFDATGNPLSIKAQVFDQSESLVTLFITNPQGYGKFTLIPDCGKSYHLKLIDQPVSGKIAVPDAMQSGIALSIKKAHQEKMFVQVSCSEDLDLSGCAIVGHLRGDNLWLQQELTGRKTTLEVHTKDLAAGVHHITVFDQNGLPSAERLVYIHGQPEHLAIESLDLLSRSSEQEVTVKLNTPLREDENLHAAMSIYQADLGYPVETLNSYLLLNSDLRGTIRNPMQYFPPDKEPNLAAVDLLLMTHGWRRFDWSSLLKQAFPKMEHAPENGFTFLGEIEPDKAPKKKSLPAEVQMTLINNGFNSLSVVVDARGKFVVPNIEISDTTKVLIKAVEQTDPSKKTKAKNLQALDLSLSFREGLIDAHAFESKQPAQIDLETLTQYAELARYNQEITTSYEDVWSIDLEEVVVSERRKDPQVLHHEKTMLYSDPDTRLLLKDIPGSIAFSNVFDFLQARVPGLEVRGTFPNKTVRIRGTSTILGDANAQFMLDGAYVPSDLLNYYPIDQIAFVDVIRSLSKATVLGGTAGGIVAIYSKPVQGNSGFAPESKSITLNHPGYYQAIEYYVPSTSEVTEQYLRNRSTLYWNANLDLSKGSAKYKFYTSDKESHYFVFVEGVSNQGRIFEGIKKLHVQ